MPWFFWLHLGASAVTVLGLLAVIGFLLCLLCEDGLEILATIGIGQLR
ncbi:MAG: hypothetical protein AAB880_01830 [Patescibacteria group bacterium]